MGTAVDFLTPPLSPAELAVGFTRRRGDAGSCWWGS